MSVYSGFATRQQENAYNDLLLTYIATLKKRVMKFYAGEPCNEGKFQRLLKNIHNRMSHYELSKFSEPKYSLSMHDLLAQLNNQANEASHPHFNTILDTPLSSFIDPQSRIRESRFEDEEDQKEGKIKGSRRLRSLEHLSYDQRAVSVKKRCKSIENTPKLTPYIGKISERIKVKLEQFRQIRSGMRMPKVDKYLPTPKPNNYQDSHISLRRKPKIRRVSDTQ